ncbi:MAG: hypothetical protein MUD01_02855 [Chloroflexaceae bacterium]|jgi:hypothetical protein|nr:hypothetical protein [Chloroflexaceae bacterium]
MTTSLRYKGRLPGVVVNTPLPALEAPLRLDVAGFVGFAERGPLHTPVALEDSGQYAAVFGGDLAVARVGGRPLYAALPTAVRAFFDNGGRRCYAVRVAGATARRARFRLPGLVALQADQTLAPAIAEAAWVGRWAERLTVWTQLLALPLKLVAGSLNPAGSEPVVLTFDLPTPALLHAGDLLRLQFATGETVYGLVQSVSGPSTPVGTTSGVAVAATLARATLCAPAQLPPPGDFAPLPAQLQPLPHGVPVHVERLRFALRLREGEQTRERFDELSFGPGTGDWTSAMCHWRDEVNEAGPPFSQPAGRSTLLREPASTPLLYLPLGMALLPDDDAVSGPLALDASDGLETFDPTALFLDSRLASLTTASLASAAERLLYLSQPAQRLTGLHSLWGIEEVAVVALPDLVQPGWPARLAPIPVDPLPPLPPPAPAPDWSEFQGCAQPPPPTLLPDEVVRRFYGFLLPITQGDLSPGLDESARALLSDSLRASLAELGLPTALSVDGAALGFQVNLPPCSAASVSETTILGTLTLASGVEVRTDFTMRRFGEVWQIHAIASRIAISTPSETQRRLAQLPPTRPADEFDMAGLVRVQAGLVRFCAGRTDVTGVLSLPLHARRREVADWRQQFDGAVEQPSAVPLSYVAAYHPWLEQPEATTPELAPLRATPPDGAACGLIAARERERGAWITPAGVALRGVVGLTPLLSEAEAGELFDAPAQLNLVQQQPGRFVPISAHTLSQERSYWQLAVRRLLILLRKFALRRGMRYVFESNNERFRRMVRGEFERLLGLLAARGALAAYQVVIDEGLNTQNDIDNGRFLIALKVAPIAPIEFITVTLLRSGEGLLSVIES